MLILFDLDGTLVESYMDREDKDYSRVIFPDNVLVALEELAEASHEFGVITNQAGIAFGYNSQEDYHLKIDEVLTQLGWPMANVKVCFAHPEGKPPYNEPAEVARRKPSPAMITELMNDLGYQPDETVYVGDMDSDAEAAAHAGVQFYWASDFFGNERFRNFL